MARITEAESPAIGEDDDRVDGALEGTALCLSGGGYRAMLFHAGALWRLNELGALRTLDRVCSVSGGSIAAAVLGHRWSSLDFGDDGVARNLEREVVAALRSLAEHTIDAPAIVRGVLGGSVAQQVVAAYRARLFGAATLQDLPDRPRFVFHATNVQTAALFRFSKPYAADYRIGALRSPAIPLAVAVAASSAFPPVLSPLEIALPNGDVVAMNGADLHRPPYTTRVVLTDGGVYDNLGIESAWKRHKTVLVSDGGGHLAPEPTPRRDWARHSLRVFEIVDAQVRALRKRQIIAAFADRADPHQGTFWGIRTHIADYGLEDALPCTPERTLALAETPTRLRRLEPDLQQRLINWGYAVCDAAVRRHVTSGAPRPSAFPFPAAGV
jgi:NTE family protein